MAELTQKSLRGILAKILSVDEKYIIPKQGTWFNPQEMLPVDERPATWCAYRIVSNMPRTVPYYSKGDRGNRVLTQKIATIELQFVGTHSESLAQSVALWALREDVKKSLEEVQGAILASEMNAFSSNFFQEGKNTVLAWNVRFRVLWVSVTDINQDNMKNIILGGQYV